MPVTDEMVEAALDAADNATDDINYLAAGRDGNEHCMRAALAAAYPLVAAECAAVAGVRVDVNDIVANSHRRAGSIDRQSAARRDSREEEADLIKRAILALCGRPTMPSDDMESLHRRFVVAARDSADDRSVANFWLNYGRAQGVELAAQRLGKPLSDEISEIAKTWRTPQ